MRNNCIGIVDAHLDLVADINPPSLGLGGRELGGDKVLGSRETHVGNEAGPRGFALGIVTLGKPVVLLGEFQQCAQESNSVLEI